MRAHENGIDNKFMIIAALYEWYVLSPTIQQSDKQKF